MLVCYFISLFYTDNASSPLRSDIKKISFPLNTSFIKFSGSNVGSICLSMV